MNVYVPDLWIAGFNQLLFFLAVWLVFRLARRLFDEPVAWLSAGVFAGAELFWRFSTSGLSTMLLTFLFVALIDVLSRLESQGRDGLVRGAGRLAVLAALAGVLTGLLGLTRYSFGWVMIPVILFVTASPLPKRTLMIASCVFGFSMVVAPWIARNYLVSGTPFGTAGYAALEETAVFPGFELPRTLNPNFSLMEGRFLWRKLLSGLREILEKQLPRLGGSWVTAFFLVGLLMPFRNPMLRRLRLFAVGCLSLLLFVQASGRTGLTVDSPEVNSENLLVVVAPILFMFGVSLFFVLVEQFEHPCPDTSTCHRRLPVIRVRTPVVQSVDSGADGVGPASISSQTHSGTG
jgi:4-amino-4-deoxy-L-arabinose transferase-like glycosyltransferase